MPIGGLVGRSRTVERHREFCILADVRMEMVALDGERTCSESAGPGKAPHDTQGTRNASIINSLYFYPSHVFYKMVAVKAGNCVRLTWDISRSFLRQSAFIQLEIPNLSM